MSAAQAKAWRAIVACRTEALGGHVEACDRLREERVTCTTRAATGIARNVRAGEGGLARGAPPRTAAGAVLPSGVHAAACAERSDRRRPAPGLRDAIRVRRRPRSASSPATAAWLGGVPAFTLVLHTWKQDLARHIHLHALMAGGALAPSGEWIAPKQGFLFPVHALSKVFRGKFVAALEILRAAGRLPANLTVQSDWQRLRSRLYAHDWVVYAKEPLGGPEAVLDYLGRYTHRVAISNERILGIDGHEVLLRVRADDASGRKRTLRVPGTEFIDRFLQHVLPCGFKRIRHYGLLAPAHKRTHLAAARAALGAPPPQPVVIETVAAFCVASRTSSTRAARIAAAASFASSR